MPPGSGCCNPPFTIVPCVSTPIGFQTRETISKMTGAPLRLEFPGYDVRPARATDLAACNALCQRVHGHHRGGELDDATTAGTARVVEHLGKITAYATD